MRVAWILDSMKTHMSYFSMFNFSFQLKYCQWFSLILCPILWLAVALTGVSIANSKSIERWQHDCEPLERLLLRVDTPHLTKSDMIPIWWSCRWAATFGVQWKPGLSCVVQTRHKTNCSVLTCVNPGEGAGFGTEVGPVIGCGGLFISRSFMVLH